MEHVMYCNVLCYNFLKQMLCYPAALLCGMPRWRKQLDELKRRWAAEQVASDRAWAAKLEEQHNKWLKVGGLAASAVLRICCACHTPTAGWLVHPV